MATHALRSCTVTQGRMAAGARALWRATGVADGDFGKPIIAIANAYTQFVPGHVHLKNLGDVVAEEIAAAGGIGREFNTIAVDDGIAMGHEGMRYSLPSRDLIADAVETMVQAHRADALVCISNCDKITPAMLMAALRLNIPTIFVSGGPMESGVFNHRGVVKRVDAIDSLMVMGDPKSTEADLHGIQESACPTCGSCAIMGTANSMNCITEGMGLALPGNGTLVATHKDREGLFRAAGRRIVELARAYYEQGDERVLPRSIATKQGFEHGMRVSMAIGGSTNTTLHLLAAAREAQVDFTIDDIARVSDTTPLICKVSPARHEMFIEDMHRAGGVMRVLGELDRAGLIDKSLPCVHATSLGDALAHWDLARCQDHAEADATQTFYRAGPGGVRSATAFSQSKRFPSIDLDGIHGCIHDAAHAFDTVGGLAVLYGNLAPNSAVVKSAAVPDNMKHFTGRAICFELMEDACAAIQDGTVQAGHVVVIRYEGPRGGPGMREMLLPTGLLVARKLHTQCALVTDGRFSGATEGLAVGHVSPEAASGGVIALIEDGDEITFDIPGRGLHLRVDEATLQARAATMRSLGDKAWRPTKPRTASLWLRSFGALASSADQGGGRDPQRLAQLEALQAPR
ncbi:dihydroxy-acid dehydratase [Acidovorax sp.]|uniref:dihydroxy-acid dehydratase n=1 Tax=Acidovorax sp. TaxID=1872122 RepID=UPI002615E7FE|nr:dihydroxy-acid dehydratase [Acidovorax sp.]